MVSAQFVSEQLHFKQRLTARDAAQGVLQVHANSNSWRASRAREAVHVCLQADSRAPRGVEAFLSSNQVPF